MQITTADDLLPRDLDMIAEPPTDENTVNEHDTLKYSLLGPSLTKSGQDNVDQTKVSVLGGWNFLC